MWKAAVERIKPGRWFTDGGGRRMMKIQDVLPSGIPQTCIRLNPTTGEILSDFTINAIDEEGIPCACPYGMVIFQVASKDDLYEEGSCHAKLAPTVRHIEDMPKLKGFGN